MLTRNIIQSLLFWFAILLPPLGALLYFVVLEDSPLANDVYALIKVGMFVVALLGWRLSRRSMRKALQGTARDVRLGILTGLLLTGILAITFLFLQSWLLPFRDLVENKAASLFSLSWYLPITVAFSVVHALFEEWYWRGYVYHEMECHVPTHAVWLCALAFSAHHVIVLSQMFPGMLTVLFSLGIFAAALFWTKLYRRTGTLLAPWISHIFADATVFFLGYLLM